MSKEWVKAVSSSCFVNILVNRGVEGPRDIQQNNKWKYLTFYSDDVLWHMEYKRLNCFKISLDYRFVLKMLKDTPFLHTA
jgi:hypothetical protein